MDDPVPVPVLGPQRPQWTPLDTSRGTPRLLVTFLPPGRQWVPQPAPQRPLQPLLDTSQGTPGVLLVLPSSDRQGTPNRDQPPQRPIPVFTPRRLAPTGTDPDAEIDPRISDEDVVVHKLEVRDAAGARITVWIAEEAMTTSENSNPPNTTFLPLIQDPGNYRTQMFNGGSAPGLLTPSFGNTSYENTGGYFDAWDGYITDGGKITAYIGPYGGEFPSEFRKVFIAYIEGNPTFPGSTMQLSFRGREKLLQKDVAPNGFVAPLGSEGGIDFVAAGIPGARRQQIVMGTPPPFKPILTNDLENIFFCSANVVSSTYNFGVPTVWDGGVELLPGGGFGSGGGGYFNMPYGPRYPNGPTIVQPVSQVRYELRVEMTGLYSPGDVTPRPWTICDLLRQAGISIDPNDPDQFAPGSTNFSCGNRLVETQTVAQVLQDVATYEVAVIGFDRLDRFFAYPIVPSFSGASAHTFTDSATYPEGTASGWQAEKAPGQEKRAHKVRVFSGATTRSALAGIVEDDVRDVMTRDPWMRVFTAQVLYNTGVPFYSLRLITDVDPTAVVDEVEIQAHNILTVADMEAFALRYLKLRGSKQSGASFTVPFDLEAMALIPDQRVTLRTTRFGGNRQASIWALDVKLKREQNTGRTISFRCWSHLQTGSTIENDAPTIIDVTEEDSVEGAGGGGAGGAGVAGRGDAAIQLEHDYTNLCDKTSALVTGESAQDFIAPYDGTLVQVIGAVSTVLASGSLVIDVKVNTVSIMSVKITVESGERSSLTAATQPAISAPSFLKGDRFTFHQDSVGTGGKGSSVILVFYQTRSA